ncbi:MAG: DUF3299 domain-containing protein [Pseudomonadota bacterium]
MIRTGLMIAALVAPLTACEEAPATAVSEDNARLITWEELLPEGEEERLAKLYEATLLYNVPEGGATDIATQIGTYNTVKELDGIRVRLPGYTVPFDYGPDAELAEFLLVPYFGACLHAPPPPPNQTVFVQADPPIKWRDLAQAAWVEGTLRTEVQSSELADAAYTIELSLIEPY